MPMSVPTGRPGPCRHPPEHAAAGAGTLCLAHGPLPEREPAAAQQCRAPQAAGETNLSRQRHNKRFTNQYKYRHQRFPGESQFKTHVLPFSEHVPCVGSAKRTLAHRKVLLTNAQAAPTGARLQVACVPCLIKT